MYFSCHSFLGDEMSNKEGRGGGEEGVEGGII
jgi:hypothetical protein